MTDELHMMTGDQLREKCVEQAHHLLREAAKIKAAEEGISYEAAFLDCFNQVAGRYGYMFIPAIKQ
jgi:hypothetical protein